MAIIYRPPNLLGFFLKYTNTFFFTKIAPKVNYVFHSSTSVLTLLEPWHDSKVINYSQV